VKQSDGSIWVYSEPGQGTTFKIYLPRVEAAAEPPAPKPMPPASVRGSETILLAEDEEAVRNLMRRVLEAHGYTLLVAADGQEALRLADGHKGPIHLLLTAVAQQAFCFAGTFHSFGFGIRGLGFRRALRPSPFGEQAGEAGGRTNHALVTGVETETTALDIFAREGFGFGVFASAAEMIGQIVEAALQLRRVIGRDLACPCQGLAVDRLQFGLLG